MNKPMTLEQMLETGRPAYSQDLFYRFDPGKGFAVASFVRFSPSWLPCTIPSAEVQWIHEEACDCHICRPAATVTEQPKTREFAAA